MQHAVHALQHIGRVPPGHSHVPHGIGALFGGKLGCSPQLLSLRRQRGHILGVGLGQRLHSGHSFLKTAGAFHAIHECVLDLSEGIDDLRGNSRFCDSVKCLGRLTAEVGGTVGGLVLLGLELLNPGGQFRVFCSQIRSVHPGLFQPRAGSLKLLGLTFQRGFRVLDPLLQFGVFPLQGSGGAVGFADLLLE